MKIHIVLVLVILCFSTWAQGQTAPPQSPAADFLAPGPASPFAEPLAGRVASISAPAIAAHIAMLASPSFEGRGLSTRGLDSAIEYAAATLKLAGIAPYGAKGSYFQLVPVRQINGTTGQVEIERRDREQIATRAFLSGVDCLFTAQPAQTLKAPIVFAGHGITEPQLGRDDYAGLDVRGRVVMILGGVPADAAFQKPEILARYASDDQDRRYTAKLEIARKLGASAVLGVELDQFAEHLADNVEDEERAFRSYDPEPKNDPPILVRVSRSVGTAIMGSAALAKAISGTTSIPQPIATATIRIESQERLIISRNVLGIITGSDPKLREEAVIIGAHIDHLGMRRDSLHPGADDNASGVAALLEIAKTFAASPEKPKRSLIFAFWTGEEGGHFGSSFHAKHPRWPLSRTAAYLNLDMIAHPWVMSEIRKLVEDAKLPEANAFLAAVNAETFVEPGVPRGIPQLEQALRNSARGNGLAMHIDWTDGKNGGSDYRAFARENVPFIRFFGNFFPDYHKPGDTAESIDPAQVQRVARFAFATAWELGNR